MKKQFFMKYNPYLIVCASAFCAGYILFWVYIWLDGQRPIAAGGGGFVYDYQTLISAIFIIVAAFIGISVPWISQQQRVSEERKVFANKAHYLAAICMAHIASFKNDNSLDNIRTCCRQFKNVDFTFFTDQKPIYFSTREIMAFDYAKGKLSKALKLAERICKLIDRAPNELETIAKKKHSTYMKFLQGIIDNLDYICPELELSKKKY